MRLPLPLSLVRASTVWRYATQVPRRPCSDAGGRAARRLNPLPRLPLNMMDRYALNPGRKSLLRGPTCDIIRIVSKVLEVQKHLSGLLTGTRVNLPPAVSFGKDSRQSPHLSAAAMLPRSRMRDGTQTICGRMGIQ